MASWRYYSNTSIADTLLVSGGGNLSTSATSIYAGSGAPAGYPAQFPWILNIEPGTANSELVLVVSGAGTLASPWIITRAQDGTIARAHTAGVAVQHTMSAGDLTTAASHEAAVAAQLPHGLPAAAWLTGAFATIAETVTTSGQTSVSGTLGTTTGSWSAIPGTYKHLLVTGQGRVTEAAVYSDDLLLTFNGDASAVYAWNTIFSANPGGVQNNVGVPATGYAAAAMPLFRLMTSGFGSGVNAGGGFAIIPNYSGATFNKTMYSVSGGGDGTSSFVDLRIRVGVYNPSVQAAVTALSIAAPGSGYVTGSVFGLYGFG